MHPLKFVLHQKEGNADDRSRIDDTECEQRGCRHAKMVGKTAIEKQRTEICDVNAPAFGAPAARRIEGNTLDYEKYNGRHNKNVDDRIFEYSLYYAFDR